MFTGERASTENGKRGFYTDDAIPTNGKRRVSRVACSSGVYCSPGENELKQTHILDVNLWRLACFLETFQGVTSLNNLFA